MKQRSTFARLGALAAIALAASVVAVSPASAAPNCSASVGRPYTTTVSGVKKAHFVYTVNCTSSTYLEIRQNIDHVNNNLVWKTVNGTMSYSVTYSCSGFSGTTKASVTLKQTNYAAQSFNSANTTIDCW